MIDPSDLPGVLAPSDFQDLLTERVQGFVQGQGDWAVVALGIDQLASLNTTLGEQGTDREIRRVAAVLVAQVSPLGAVGYFGEGQFKLLLPADRARLLAAQIQEALRVGGVCS